MEYCQSIGRKDRFSTRGTAKKKRLHIAPERYVSQLELYMETQKMRIWSSGRL